MGRAARFRWRFAAAATYGSYSINFSQFPPDFAPEESRGLLLVFIAFRASSANLKGVFRVRSEAKIARNFPRKA